MSFDLLLSRNEHLEGNEETSHSRAAIEGKEYDKILVWKNVFSRQCHVIPNREGHSAVSIGLKLFVFGGIETGKRVNTIARYDISNFRWSLVHATGSMPCPRTEHCSLALKERYMIVFGGEAVRDSHSSAPADSGICPNDSISLYNKTQDKSFNLGNEERYTLDDLLAFDTLTNVWYRLPCNLAPLPRKSSSFTLVPASAVSSQSKETISSQSNKSKSSSSTTISEEESLLMIFGGYSSEHNTASNSVHVASSSAVLNLISALQNGTKDMTLISTNLQWRVLFCHGTLPAARHKHTATLVTVNGGSCLAVYGGITAKNEILGDVNILNLSTLTWSTLYASPISELSVNGLSQTQRSKSKGFSQRIRESSQRVESFAASSSGTASTNSPPSPGLFSHSCVAIRRPNDSLDEQTRDDDFSLIIIFGGQSHVETTPETASHHLFCFDLHRKQWYRVKSSHLFPSQRYGQSLTICRGLTLNHSLPSTSNSSVTSNDTNCLQFSPGCEVAIMYGGILHHPRIMTSALKPFLAGATNHEDPSNNEIISQHSSGLDLNSSDIWILDLTWRELGLQQFDNLHQHRVLGEIPLEDDEEEDDEEEVVVPIAVEQVGGIDLGPQIGNKGVVDDKHSTRTLGRPRSSASLLRQSASNASLLSRVDSQTDTDALILKLRRERAESDSLLKQERELVSLTEVRCEQLQSELSSSRIAWEEKEQEYQYRIRELELAMDASKNRENALQRNIRELEDLMTLTSLRTFL